MIKIICKTEDREPHRQTDANAHAVRTRARSKGGKCSLVLLVSALRKNHGLSVFHFLGHLIPVRGYQAPRKFRRLGPSFRDLRRGEDSPRFQKFRIFREARKWHQARGRRRDRRSSRLGPPRHAPAPFLGPCSWRFARARSRTWGPSKTPARIMQIRKRMW